MVMKTNCGTLTRARDRIAFPRADLFDFDSSEMGVGLPEIGATKQSTEYDLPVTPEQGFKSGDIVTYFCRIHPSMRGAFEVTDR